MSDYPFTVYSKLWTLPSGISTNPTSCSLIYTSSGLPYNNGYTFSGGATTFHSTWWEANPND